MNQNGLIEIDAKSIIRLQRKCRHNEKLVDCRIWRLIFEVKSANYNRQPIRSRARMFSPSCLVKNVQEFKQQVVDSRKFSNNMTTSNDHSSDEDEKNSIKSFLKEELKYMAQVHQNLI